MRFKEAKKLNKGLSNKVEALENDHKRLKEKYKKLFEVAQVLAGCSSYQKDFHKEVEKHGLNPDKLNSTER